ncbi:MAG: hydroxymethylglutaryl-CoA reductase, degradative [Candidatus Bathyarchaeia archaeon]
MKMERSSNLPGFYKLEVDERLELVKKFAGLTDEEKNLMKSTGALKTEIANRMIENVIGALPVPLGVAVNFTINGRDYLIPMAIEEPSVVAAASHAAKLAKAKGGFTTTSTQPVMIGQIQVIDVRDPYGARVAILSEKEKILQMANDQDPLLISLGGGARDLQTRVIHTHVGPMLLVELLVDCRDAMGANAVNTMVEAVAPLVAEVSNGKVLLRIITNLATQRLSRARAVIQKDKIGGDQGVDGVIAAYAFAAADPYRCATHNKGIMNGTSAVVLATGNDTRAVEAGAHAYAARTGHYSPLTFWEKNDEGDLVGSIEIPTAAGLVGGATATNPIAKIAVKILGVKTARELGEILAAVGLAQNFAALRALSQEGIQRGHMSLHARNVAIAAGATRDLIEKVSEKMIAERKVRLDRAKEILESLQAKK